MKEQHEKIKGYRKLTDVEIDLMNRIKSIEADVAELYDDIENLLIANFDSASITESYRIQRSNASGWLTSGYTDACKGLMQLVRAVAQPECQLFLRQQSIAERAAKAEGTGNLAEQNQP